MRTFFRKLVLLIGVPILALSVLALSIEARSELHSRPQHLAKQCKAAPDTLEHRVLSAPPEQPVAWDAIAPQPGPESFPSLTEPLYARPVHVFRVRPLRAPPSFRL